MEVVVVMMVVVFMVMVVFVPLDHRHHVALRPQHGRQVPNHFMLHHGWLAMSLEWRVAFSTLLPVPLVTIGLRWGLWWGLWKVVAILSTLGQRDSLQAIAERFPWLAAACCPKRFSWTLG